MSKTIQASLTMYLEIYDTELLRKAAAARAVEDGIDPECWEESRAGLEDDLRMLFDPGLIPGSGIDIVDSHCETN